MITFVVDDFVNIANNVEASSKTYQNDRDRNLKVANAVALLKMSNEGGSISYDIGRDPKRLLSIAAMSLMSSCSNIFQKESDASDIDVVCKLFFKSVVARTARLQDGKKELKIAFLMPFNGHYYIVLAAHAFNDYVCDWIGLANDCFGFLCVHIERMSTII